MDPDTISRIEYEVTSYRNVLDQLNTLSGTMNSLYDGLRHYLAREDILGSTIERSGWAMKEYGGKSETRWTDIVAGKIGLGSMRNGLWPTNVGAPYFHVYDKPKISSFRNKVSPNYRVTESSLRSRVYDVLSLVRSLEWEMNRLRLPMPYDLRQLSSQLNRHATDFGNVIRTPNVTGRGTVLPVKDAVSVFVVFREVKKFRDSWLPKMLSTIRDRIKKKELQKKVAEETLRRENEATIKEPAPKTGEQEQLVEQVATQGEPENALNQPASKSGEQERLAKLIAEQMRKQNRDEVMTVTGSDPEKEEGKKGAVAVGGLVALLALLGAA